MSEQGFRLQCSTASSTGMCCHPPEQQRAGGCWKPLQEHNWFPVADPGTCNFLEDGVSSPSVFLAISSAKQINKHINPSPMGAATASSFSSVLLPHLDAMGTTQWEASRGESSPHLPPAIPAGTFPRPQGPGGAKEASNAHALPFVKT